MPSNPGITERVEEIRDKSSETSAERVFDV